MNKELCIVHANCQGEPLVSLLRLCPEFERRFEPRVFLNYAREPIPDEALARCRLFLYQHLGPQWNGLASEALLRKLDEDCASLCIPNMFLKAYWPLWSGEPGFDFRDVLLDRLLGMGLGRREILHVYLRGPLAAKYDLAGLIESSKAYEREKETRTPVKYLHLVEERLREERLFNTVNHPNRRLLFHAASEILRLLGLGPLDPELEERIPEPFPEFELPIHPQVAQWLGLSFAAPGTRFAVFGRRLAFEEYAAAYVDCRLAGSDDLVGHLQTGPQ
jgi:hypothetical protein